MRGTFQAENFDLGRISPDMAEGLAMDRLLANRGNQHLHPVLFQKGGETQFAFFVSQHRRCAVEAPVTQSSDDPWSLQGLLSGPVQAPAQ